MKKIGIAILALVAPMFAGAQTADASYITDILEQIMGILDAALPVIIAAAVVYFVYGVARYVMSGDEEAKKEAKSRIIYGIIGLFVMVSVWGLVTILKNITGVEDENAPSTEGLLPER